MIGELIFKEGKLVSPNATPSLYAPSVAVTELIAQVKKDYEQGIRILNTNYSEFGGEGLTPLSVAERDKKAFNSYEEPVSEDPDAAWRWKGVRPTTRNKTILIAGNFIAAMLYPNVFAQNKEDEEDKEAANLMKDLIIWNIENSNYKTSYLFGVVAALMNPAAYWEVEFAEIINKVKEKIGGRIQMRKAIDELLSGFQLHTVPLDELLIDNAYEYEIQNQRFLGRRRFLSFEEAKSRFGEHANWKYVRPGYRTIFDIPSQAFFDVHEELNPALTEWFVYYNRLADMEISFVNGIYFGSEDIEANFMRHRRAGRGIDGKPLLFPVYPYAKFGYSPIDEQRFFFYKSFVNENGPQQRLVNKMWQMVMDGTFLEVLPPLGIVSSQTVRSNILYPGAMNTFRDKDTTITPLRVGTNLTAGYNAMSLAEVDMQQTGKTAQLPARPGTTATEIAAQTQQAREQMGLFWQMIATAVKSIGALMIDVILQHQTVGDIEEITAGTLKLRYKRFLLPKQKEGGKNVTKVIDLTNERFEGTLEESFGIMEREGGLDTEKRIYKVNPALFRRMKFLVTIDADQLAPKNEIFEKAMRLEAYDRLIQNPFVDHEAVTRDYLVEPFAKSETEKYMKKEIGIPQETGRAPLTQGTRPGTLVSQITGNSPLAEMVRAG